MENTNVLISFWGTRSYDVCLSGYVDKKDYDAAVEEVGDSPRELYIYLTDIGYEFDTADLSEIDEVITDVEVYDSV